MKNQAPPFLGSPCSDVCGGQERQYAEAAPHLALDGQGWSGFSAATAEGPKLAAHVSRRPRSSVTPRVHGLYTVWGDCCGGEQTCCTFFANPLRKLAIPLDLLRVYSDPTTKPRGHISIAALCFPFPGADVLPWRLGVWRILMSV